MPTRHHQDRESRLVAIPLRWLLLWSVVLSATLLLDGCSNDFNLVLSLQPPATTAPSAGLVIDANVTGDGGEKDLCVALLTTSGTLSVLAPVGAASCPVGTVCAAPTSASQRRALFQYTNQSARTAFVVGMLLRGTCAQYQETVFVTSIEVAPTNQTDAGSDDRDAATDDGGVKGD